MRIYDYIKKTVVASLLLMIPLISSAQNRVTGVVYDHEGLELLGVTIQVKGTSKGTVTDIDGKYSLDIEDGDVLVYSFIGYATKEIAVGNQSVIDVNMDLDLKQLDEVVVVGYGTMRKSDLTGAVTSLDSDEIAKTRSANAVEVLQGKSAGVDIVRSSGRAGSGYDIQVRGNRSLSGDNDPLYIVDGVPFGNELTIDANDIQSIEILKDASSTAIYGSRGANGVIIVTTKSGSTGKPRLSFNMYAGVTKSIGSVPLGDGAYQLQLYNDLEWMRRWQQDPTELPRSNGYTSEIREFEDPNTNFDWYDFLLQDGMQQNYNLSFSGQNDKLAYSTSVSHYRENGLVDGDSYERSTFRINLEGELTKNISIGTNSVVSFIKNNQRANPFSDARKLSPLSVPFDSAGNILPFPRYPEEVVNPMIEADPDYYLDERRRARTFSTVYAKLSFLDDNLTFRTSFNFDLDFKREGLFEGVYPGVNGVSSAEVENSIGTDYTFQNVVNYKLDLNSVHRLNFTAGNEIIYRRTEKYRGYGQDLGLPTSQWYGLGSASQNVTLALEDLNDFPLTESALSSFFGRVHYSLFDRYLFQLTGRYDGSSRLAEGNKWDFFPSASFAWRVIDEPFFPDQNVLTNLKMRVGYGVSGNQAVTPYSALGTVTTNPIYYEFGLSETQYNGFRTGKTENTQLGWELTTAWNFGIDFEFLDGKISGTVERYITNTSDVLQIQSLSPHSGIPSITANVGETKNSGWEATLNANVLRIGDFSWNTAITFYSNKEEITALASGVEQDLLNGWFVGHPFEVYYDRRAIGIWQLGEEEAAAEYGLTPGDIKFEDIPGEEDDRQIIGTPRPKWNGGFNNTFSYKDFDLSILAFARMGQTIRDEVLSYFSVDGLTSSMALDYWTPFNPSNTTPRLDPTRTLSGYQGLRALEYVDGSFMKIRDITLGYNIPSAINETLGVSSIRVYATVKNAFIFGKYYDGGNRYDPELKGDIEIPMPRLFAGGLSVVF